MTDQAPAPLVAAEIDLRDLDGFMLNVERLLASELWALSTGEELKAAVGLWCRAWKQIPAASLPDNDRILASFASVSVQRWARIKPMAMRGFILCLDGRWYHKVLAEDALRAWGRKQAFKERSAKGNAKRWSRDSTQDEHGSGAPSQEGREVSARSSPSDERQAFQNASHEDSNKESLSLPRDRTGQDSYRDSSLRSRNARARDGTPEAEPTPAVQSQPDGEMPEFLRRFPDQGFAALAKAYPNPPNSSLPKAFEVWKSRTAGRPTVDVLLHCASLFVAFIAEENRKRPKDDPFRVCSLATWLEEERWASFLDREGEAKQRSHNGAHVDPGSIWGGHPIVPRMVEVFGAGMVSTWFSDSSLTENSEEVTIVTRRAMSRDYIATNFAPRLERLFGNKPVNVVLAEGEGVAA